jgi:hypothetical protein
MQDEMPAKRKGEFQEEASGTSLDTTSTRDTALQEVVQSSFTGVPNSQLSQEEKEAKRLRKKKIKLQAKIESIEKSIKHSRARKDVDSEKVQQKALDELLEKEHETVQELQLNTSSNSYSLEDLKGRSQPFVLEISLALFDSEASLHFLGESDKKKSQMTEAVLLLKHMTRGTQELCMFQNKAALWGYTRKKFHERAILLTTSLGRIQIPTQEHMKHESAIDPKLHEQRQIRQHVWNMFTSGKVRKACSIGCGPGNDLAGLISFLRMLHVGNGINAQVLDRALLIDWSVDEWKGAVIDPLNDILVSKGLLSGIDTIFCDVTKDINDDGNKNAFDQLRGQDQCQHLTVFDFDFYSVSYLLSETRGKWVSFFESVVKNAKPGAMFYFAEPIPWQLHRFIGLFNKKDLQFIWLDSSMDHPMLQDADRRAGPSVLFAIKTEIGQQ